MTADRDAVVGAVLDLLPVDGPGPGFWEDLQARLQTEAPPLAVVDAPRSAEVTGLRPAPATPRPGGAGSGLRRRRIVVGALAAAALVVAVVVGTALRDDRDNLDTGYLDQPGGTDLPVTTPTTTALTTVATTPEGAVRQAALQWVEAVVGGDLDTAWALLGPQSRESIGGVGALGDLMVTDLPQTWGRWAQLGEAVVTPLNLGSAAEPRWWGVVFDDGVPGDGHGTAVMAARLGNDLSDVTVEPFLPGPALDLIVTPSPVDGRPSLVPADGPIEVHLDTASGHAVVAIDGVAATEDQLQRDAEGTVVAVRPARPLSEDTTHVITVVQLTGDDDFLADSRVVRVV